jgi:cysteine-rich repeat protein
MIHGKSTFLLALALAAPASARPPACADGRYLDGAPMPDGSVLSAVTISGSELALPGVCAPATASFHRARRGSRVRATFHDCGGVRGRFRLDAVLAPGCGLLRGRLRGRHGRTIQIVHARRSGCGDGAIDTGIGEECESAFDCGGLACRTDCRCEREPTTTSATTATTTTTSSTTSTTAPPIFVPSCGNGRIEPGEECDGAALGGATCPAGSTGAPVCDDDCRLDYGRCMRCGDGKVDPGEECDDANDVDGDGCSTTCRLECGDGVLQPRYEACDDGNRENGDGCADVCLWERAWDGGGGEAVDRCMLGWNVELAAAAPLGPAVVCRDGSVPCDRGLAGDGLCTILVFFCVNNPSFTSSACAPTDVAHVELEGASLTGPGALQPAEQGAVLDAFTTMLGRWGGSTVTRSGPMLDVSPPVRGTTCGQFVLPVPVTETRTVALRVTDSTDVVDDDEITFQCEDSP